MAQEIPRVKSRKASFLAQLVTLISILACTAEPPLDQVLWKVALKEKGNVVAVRKALSQGADVNVRKGGWTLLMSVSREGSLEIAQILLADGADPNAKGFGGETALTIAAEHGHAEIVKVLLANGADKNAITNNGDNALHYASEYGHRTVVEVLVDTGIDLNQKDKDGETPLAIAKRRSNEDVVQLLMGADAKR